MKFKAVKPFVVEMLIFIFVVICIFAGLLVGDYVEIKFNIHLITLVFIILIIVILIYYFSRIVNLGVKALIDYIFQYTREGEFEIIKMLPYKASIFTEKYGHKGKEYSSIGAYYLYRVKNYKDEFTFISPCYLNLCEGNIYKIKVASLSSIIIEYSEK